VDIYARLTPIFRDVFDSDSIVVTPNLSAKDVEEWDSLGHVRLIVAIETDLKIRFDAGEINGLKNVGELVKVTQRHMGKDTA
jgi:acyl carrier protein